MFFQKPRNQAKIAARCFWKTPPAHAIFVADVR
jgi:hypothetical protein